MGEPATFNFADIWEAVWPRSAERTALVCGQQRRTYRELAERTNQLARHLHGAGIGPGDHVGLFLRNGVEYLEAMLAAFTLQAVPVNINYRYVADELRHLVTDSESVALLFHSSLGGAVAELGPEVLGSMRTILAIDDGGAGTGVTVAGARPYEDALAGRSTEPLPNPGRTGDDHYLMYTGGTTGLPKGVLWRQEDAFYACIGGGDPSRLNGAVERPEQVLDRIGQDISYLPVAPLMHAAAQWTTLMWLFAGGKTTLMPGSFQPPEVWQAVQDEAVNTITVVGDAVGGPLLRAWLAEPDRWDVSSLFAISNGGAPMSPSLKARIAETFPDVMVIDGFGSSETGAQGSHRLQRGDAGRSHGVTRFAPYENTLVVDEDGHPMEPGSEVTGRVALRGRIPLGYLNDPEKTAATFVEVDGVRHVLTGDQATVAADGTIQLLGRGSQCINTGGEKVFPEEVEGVLHGHPSVGDVLVVGVPDERWGSAVVAIVAPLSQGEPPTLERLRDHCRASLAGYKLPKDLVLVDAIQRSPAGKADYRWAAHIAAEELSGRPG